MLPVLLLSLLGQPARFEALGTVGCPNTLRALCRQPTAAGGGGGGTASAASCAICAGRNQHLLRVAGCAQADIELFCAAGVNDPSRPNVIFVLTVRRPSPPSASPPQNPRCIFCLYSSPVAHSVSRSQDDMGWGDFSYNNASKNFAFPGAGRDATDPFVPNPPRTPNVDAMAGGPHTLVFNRFYAGSAVCSPTRASVLTGRTSDRECIGGAEGCGQEPAWSW